MTTSSVDNDVVLTACICIYIYRLTYNPSLYADRFLFPAWEFPAFERSAI